MSYQNNTIEALKKLYVTMGGTAADVENLNITPEMISAIADIYQGGGGSNLPTVTADDNGKLLTVVEGDWDKANAPKELPTVTGSDNGKVLTVVEGAWDKAENAGGAVNITLSQESTATCQAALAQFVSAAVTNAGTYTRTEYSTGISEYESIYSIIAQNKIVILNVIGAGIVIGVYDQSFFSGHLIIPIQTISEQVSVSVMLDICFREDSIVMQGFAQVISE